MMVNVNDEKTNTILQCQLSIRHRWSEYQRTGDFILQHIVWVTVTVIEPSHGSKPFLQNVFNLKVRWLSSTQRIGFYMICIYSNVTETNLVWYLPRSNSSMSTAPPSVSWYITSSPVERSANPPPVLVGHWGLPFRPVEEVFGALAFFVDPFVFSGESDGVVGGNGVFGDEGKLFFDPFFFFAGWDVLAKLWGNIVFVSQRYIAILNRSLNVRGTSSDVLNG